MAKLTLAQLTAFLTTLGLKDVQLVENEADADFNNDTALQSIDAARKPIISQIVKGELKNDVHKEVAGTVNRALKKQLAEITGIDKTAIEELESQEALKTALEHYKTTMSGEKDAQAKIDEILATHKTERETLEQNWNTKYAELEGKYTKKEILAHIVKAHKDAKGLPAKANIEQLAELFYEANKGKVVMKVNESGELELYDPKAPDTRMLNTGRTANVSISDLIQPHYEGLGLWATDTRDVNALTAAKDGGDKTTVSTSTTKQATPMNNYPAHMQEFYKNLEAPVATA